ncbi:MAG: glycerate kinase, partial [Armatimonadetes bacterium]|nr:glycerate kinase [Armatimonadota bacterium]
LDAALSHYAEVLRRDLGREVKDVPGAGAAGGLGAGLLAFLNARLRRGVEIVMEAVSLEPKLAEADLVITGEGSIDGQTAFGKTVSGVATAAKRFGVPVIAIAGTIQPGAEVLIDNGVDAFFAIVDRPMSLEEAMSQALPLLEKAGERIMRLVRIRLD